MNSILGSNLQLKSQYDHTSFVELQRQMWAARLEARRAQQLLASHLDMLGLGVEIWDNQDRLVFFSERNSHMQTQPQLHELPGNRWIKTYQTRNEEGYLMVARIDVTDLVRKGHELEARNQQLAKQSATDDLTGLANRRSFDETLATEWLRAARSTSPLSFLMVDIDHFKKYNDHYGHLAGDECLRRVAGVLGQCVRRAGEVVARYGGEEFVMLLPGADMAHACETAQKCLDRMRDEALTHIASPTAPYVTISIGVACLSPDASLQADGMINAADAAMYRAKSGGRARFSVADRADWDIHNDTCRTRQTVFE
jgi:diguanylate cyclase (GGDEF)-like protein